MVHFSQSAVSSVPAWEQRYTIRSSSPVLIKGDKLGSQSYSTPPAPPCNPLHPLVQWSYFVVLSPLSPLLTSPQSALRKSIAIDFGRQQKAVGIQGEEPGRDRDREVLAERCEPLSVYACAGTAKGHRHEPLCNNRLWSVSASEVSRMRLKVMAAVNSDYGARFILAGDGHGVDSSSYSGAFIDGHAHTR